MVLRDFPAGKLKGITLNDGWYVDEKLKVETNTSGKYSTCYKVTKDGIVAFLKAFDYRDLQKTGGDGDFRRVYENFSREYNYLKECNDKQIDNVVKLITRGDYFFKAGDINTKVEYFITEFSIDGTVQNCNESDDLSNLVLKFYAIRDIFYGMESLHKHEIWHLDVKTSNVLYFIAERVAKINDFGSARRWKDYDLEVSKAKDLDKIKTTRTYSPPEVLYHTTWTTDWDLYRKKIDLYLVGNVVVKMFTGLSFTSLLKEEMSEQYNWDDPDNIGKFESFKEFLVKGAAEVYLKIEEVINIYNNRCGRPLDSSNINGIVSTIRDLCNPDPDLRGHKNELNRSGSSSDGLYRYGDRFNLLGKKAEYFSKKMYTLNNK